MKKKFFAFFTNRIVSITGATGRISLGCAGLLLASAFAGRAADLQVIHTDRSQVVTNLTPIRHSARWERLNLAIGLPLRNREGLTNLLQQLYDPASTNFHHFLTPQEFTEQFGPTEADYAAVVNFAKRNGLAVTAQHANRMLVSVRGSVGDVERTFHVTLNQYQHPRESRTFFAADREPSVQLAVPLQSVAGLDNYVLPRPCLKPSPARQGQPQLTGSGPDGAYLGNDFRAAYVPGTPLTGTGQIVGLLEFDSGYFQNDITAYEKLAGLPNVPVTPVLLDGYGGGPGDGNDEVSLDIEMAVSLAPGLKEIIVYEGSTTDDILNRMATDDLAKQIGASWGYDIDSTSEQIFQEFAAQGQSFFNASGDSDAYSGEVMSPSDDPNVTVVGGTTLTTSGPGGAYVSETVWNRDNGVGSSGGISTRYTIPSWQKGINMSANLGSTTMRNLPDVALTAENVYVIYDNGQSGAFGGTSCATPLWAAFMALANQLALANGEPVVGFINPLVYAMGKGSNALSYTSLFHDTTTGNNYAPRSPNRFPAAPGYDLCTGWGTPTGSNLISALALPEPLRIAPGGNVIVTGPVGGPFTPATQTYTLTNNGSGTLAWTLANTSVWFNVSPTSGSLIRGKAATTVSISLAPGDTNLPAGSYATTLWFTNLTDAFVQTRQAVLDVVTPPVITEQPTNEALLIGMTGNFSVGIAPDSLMFYQWQLNGTNLTDGGQISGSATSTLTITNVKALNAGAYSVILSNAAGVLASSSASLTIVPSAPVIVLEPTNEIVLPDAPATFTVAAVGNTPYTYHWQLNGTNLANNANFGGATASTLVVSNVSSARTGVYSVVVGNTLGSVTSTGAVLSAISVTASGVTMSSLYSLNDNTGGYLYSPLVQGRDGYLYGTAFEEGSDGDGSIFKCTTNGSLSTLHSFDYSDGALPYGGLCLAADNFFYGTTYFGGTYGDGTTFRISSSGGFSTLTSFDGVNGEVPAAGLVQVNGGYLYGTALEGGAYGYGTVYRMTNAGTLSTLAAFDFTDGAYPSPVLVKGNDGSLYGTTEEGGTYGAGTVFKITTAGVLTDLYSFTDGNDGAFPIAGLVQGVDGDFYGVAEAGGTNGVGTVFKITPEGVITTLYAFTGGADGEYPVGGLVQARDGNLYGTTEAGGTYGFGTVFQISPTGFLNTLAQFESYNGANPAAAMIQATDGNLYGTTLQGGSGAEGTLFKIGLSGPLQITGQPADASASEGGTAVFAVATSGGAPVTYQWQQDGVALTDGGDFSGSRTATLTITNVDLTDVAAYSVVVSNAFNSLVSDYATLAVVFSPPQITAQPVGQTCVTGATATFSVTATGDQPMTYQWQENGTNVMDGGNVAGSATSTLTLTSVVPANTGTYSVVVSNAIFSVASAGASLTVIPATGLSAASSQLRAFTGGVDGAFPHAGLMQGKDGNLYGTCASGGSHYYGNVFRAYLSGGLVNVFSFSDGNDGASPYARLVQASTGYFYGTTTAGGTNSYGTVFRMTLGGAVAGIYSFGDGTDGAEPETGLAVGTDGDLYGVSTYGGADSYGSVYRVTPAGAVTALYAFTGGTDGAYPLSDLVRGKDGYYYGTTAEGGAGGYGTVFRISSNGTFTNLASFTYANGSLPEAGVIQGADGNLYGTTVEGGANGYGTVFCVTTKGTLTTLFSFGNTNGSNPTAALVQATDGNLYGTCSSGGVGGQGTAFKITTNGVLTTLLWFDGVNGANPDSALVQATDGNLYGTTPFGGTGFNASAGGGYGLIYRLTVPVFINSSFATTSAIACLPYAGAITGKTVAPAGDTLSFAKVSGPAWLTVATNGALSGTPTNSDIGTNWFVISLTDTNGVSADANMSLVVVADPPPSFVESPFAEPWASVDESYVADLATNATAPYLSAGDVLTFAKVAGPAWLSVAADGLVSGTPDEVYAGTNLFVVSVTDLGGASNTTTMTIYVNSAPMFSPADFVKPAATVGVAYSGSIATNAVDPDLAAGDALQFYKITGPAWLSVADDGTLSGTPASADVGTESFMVLVVDSQDLAGVGMMTLTVNASGGLILPVVVMNISAAGTNLFLGWSGGTPPYQLQSTTNLGVGWQNVGSATGATNCLIAPANPGTFYRVHAQ